MNIGITGHQRLDDASMWAWVEESMRKALSQYSTPILGLSSLAVGADQLFARIVLELGGAVHAIIPFAGIERSFSSSEDLQRYRDLVADATIETLNTLDSDQDAYLAAGFRVVDLSSLLIAVWDGLPAKGKVELLTPWTTLRQKSVYCSYQSDNLQSNAPLTKQKRMRDKTDHLGSPSANSRSLFTGRNA